MYIIRDRSSPKTEKRTISSITSGVFPQDDKIQEFDGFIDSIKVQHVVF